MNTPNPPPAPDQFTRDLMHIDNLILKRDLHSAAAALNTATRTRPTDPRVFLLGMRLAEAAGNANGAIDMGKRAIALNPTWHVSVTEMAMLLSRLNKHAEAVEQVRTAVALSPRNLGVLRRAIDTGNKAADHPAWE